MTKRISKEGNIGISLVANIISIAVTFAISFFLTRYLIEVIGKAAYSYYPITDNCVNYFSLIFFALSGTSSRFISVSYYREDHKTTLSYYSSVYLANVIISLFILVFGAICTLNVGIILNIPDDLFQQVQFLFATTFLSLVVNSFSNVYMTAPYIKKRTDVMGIVDIVTNITKCALLLGLAYFSCLDLVTFGIVLLTVNVIKLILYIIFFHSLLPEMHFDYKLYDGKKTFEILRASLWIVLSNLGQILITNSHIIIANRFFSIVVGADMALAQNLVSVILAIGATIERTLIPYVLNELINYREQSAKHLEFIKNITQIIIVIPCLIVMALGETFFHLWLPTENNVILAQYSFLLLLQWAFMYNSTICRSIEMTYNTLKVPAIFQLTVGILYLVAVFTGVTIFRQGVIYVLLLGGIAFFSYHSVFSPVYVNKVLKEHGATFRMKINKDCILFAVILSIDILAVKALGNMGWIMMMGTAVILFAADLLIYMLIKRISIKSLVEYVFNADV